MRKSLSTLFVAAAFAFSAFAGAQAEARGNRVVVVQLGDNNAAFTQQMGRNNDIAIAQLGDDNQACIIQRGSNLGAEIVQTDGGSIGALQRGNSVREMSYEQCARRVFTSGVRNCKDAAIAEALGVPMPRRCMRGR